MKHKVFIAAAESGQLADVNYFLSWAPDKSIKRAIAANKYQAFRWAAANGYLDVVRCLWENASIKTRKKMLSAMECHAFRWAATNGHLELIEKLWEWATPEIKRQMFMADGFGALHGAAGNGHVAVLSRLLEMADEIGIDRQELLAKNNYYPVRWAAINDKEEMVIKLFAYCDAKNESAAYEVISKDECFFEKIGPTFWDKVEKLRKSIKASSKQTSPIPALTGHITLSPLTNSIKLYGDALTYAKSSLTTLTEHKMPDGIITAKVAYREDALKEESFFASSHTSMLNAIRLSSSLATSLS